MGRHNLKNIMAAILVAVHSGYNIYELIRSFEDVNVQDSKIQGPKFELLENIMKNEVKNGKCNLSKFTIPKEKESQGSEITS